MWIRNVKLLRYSEELVKFSKSPWLFQANYFSDVPLKKSKPAPLQERKMIDRCRVHAKGGEGGNGCASFRRSRTDRRGKPDGASGGRGGDVILECSSAIWDLSSVQHHINAKRGGHGASKNMIGSRGVDKVVQVPVGTVIHLIEGELPTTVEKCTPETLDPWDIPGQLGTDPSESTQQTTSSTQIKESLDLKKPDVVSSVGSFHQSSHELFNQESLLVNEDCTSESDSKESEELDSIRYNVAELIEPGQRVLVAQGGIGGLGNICTHKPFNLKKSGSQKEKTGSQKEKTELLLEEPSEDDEKIAALRAGLPGSETVLLLELKSIADVGLVGMPNAGKSTLLGALSRAKPVVGHYAFTTLRPNLGNMNYDDFSITVADIPGIIRGAHENRGLGHAFLRHIERTKVLAYVVDLAAGSEGRKGILPWEQLRDLVSELEFYQEGLSDRPSLVVANKIDESGAEDVLEDLKRRVSGVPVFPVCAVLEEGVLELKTGLRTLISEGRSGRLVLNH